MVYIHVYVYLIPHTLLHLHIHIFTFRYHTHLSSVSIIVTAGIYPTSDSAVTVMADQNLSLEWLSYDGPLNLSFVDFDNMAASTQTFTSQIPFPSCVEPSDTFSFRPAVPIVASFVINPASVELSGTYTASSSNGFSSSIKLTG